MNKCKTCKWWGKDEFSTAEELETVKPCGKIRKLAYSYEDISTNENFGCILWERKEDAQPL